MNTQTPRRFVVAGQKAHDFAYLGDAFMGAWKFGMGEVANQFELDDSKLDDILA